MSSYADAPAAPEAVDLTLPSAARIYDWYLGGGHNYAIDREFGRKAVKKFPVSKPLAVSNRRWLGRVVRAALAEGITQFWDLGSGVPTTGNVHEIVVTTPPVPTGPRVLYVDYEHVAVAHCELILDKQEIDWAAMVRADLRYPDRIVGTDTAARILDFSKPICVIFASVLHFVGGEHDVAKLVRDYRRYLPRGSWIAASHITVDDAPEEGAAQVTSLIADYHRTQNPAWIRGKTEFTSWFEGLELVRPGVVHLTDWRPDTPAEYEENVRGYFWAAAGRV